MVSKSSCSSSVQYSFNFTFRGVVGHFKFIYIAIFPLFIINLLKIFSSENYFKKKDFYYFISIFLFSVSLVWHQLITINQTFIFFLIPILFAFSQIYLQSLHFKFHNLINLLFFYLSYQNQKYA